MSQGGIGPPVQYIARMPDLPSSRKTAISRENLTVAQKHLRQVRAARERIKEAERGLLEAILKAHESGESLQDIGVWAELSKSRIGQIVKGESDAPKTDRPTQGGG